MEPQKMKRREALSLAAVPLLAGLPSLATAADSVSYTRELYENLLAKGEPFLLDFYADW